MNPAYRHLEEPVRIGDFTLMQLVGFLLCAMIAILWAFVLSPFGWGLTLFSAVYLAGLPAMAVLMASTTEFDAWQIVKAFIWFQRNAGAFRSGPGTPRPSYVVHPRPEKRADRKRTDERPLAVEELWGA